MMMYCVQKGTILVIEGSENLREVMLQNALNCGFDESEVEILTEIQYKERLENEPKPTTTPSLEERLASLESALIDILSA